MTAYSDTSLAEILSVVTDGYEGKHEMVNMTASMM